MFSTCLWPRCMKFHRWWGQWIGVTRIPDRTSRFSQNHPKSWTQMYTWTFIPLYTHVRLLLRYAQQSVYIYLYVDNRCIHRNMVPCVEVCLYRRDVYKLYSIHQREMYDQKELCAKEKVCLEFATLSHIGRAVWHYEATGETTSWLGEGPARLWWDAQKHSRVHREGGERLDDAQNVGNV